MKPDPFSTDAYSSSAYSYTANPQANRQSNPEALQPGSPRMGSRSSQPNELKRPRDDDGDERGKAKVPRTLSQSEHSAQITQNKKSPKTLNFYCGSAQEQGMQMIARADVNGIQSLLNASSALLDKNALLISALEAGHIGIAGLLLDARADVSCCSRKTPMMVAVEKNDLPMLDFLIARGADVNEKDSARNEMGLLALALENESMLMFNALLARGAHPEGIGLDSDASDDENAVGELTPLICAANKKNRQAVAVLLERGVAVNPRFGNEDALMKSARAGQLEIFNLLLKYGATINVHYCDPDCEDSMLTFAAEGGNATIFQQVLDARRSAGIDQLWPDEFLACVKFAAQKGASDIVNLLFGVDFMPELHIEQAQPLLESVARSGDLALFKFLETKLATVLPEWQPDIKVLFLLPLHAASKSGNQDLLRYLAQRYPDYKINEPNPHTQCTALMVATGLQHDPKRIQLMIEFGADPTIQTEHGWRGKGMNALSLAVIAENEAAVVSLLQAGASAVLPEGSAYWDPLAVAFEDCLIPYLESLSAQSPLHALAHSWSFSQMLAADPRVEGQALVCVPPFSLSAKKQAIIKLLIERDASAISRQLRLEESRFDELYVGPLSREQARPAPLMLAASTGSLELVAFMLSRGAAVNEHAPQLPNATQYAIDHLDLRMLELLLQHGGRPNLPEPAAGWPPAVADLLRHAQWLMAPTLSPQQLEFTGIPLMSSIDMVMLADELSNELLNTIADDAGHAAANGVPQWAQKLERAGVCRAITLQMAQKLRNSPQLQALLTSHQPTTTEQRQLILAILLKELTDWVAGWPPGSSPYDGPDCSEAAKARLDTLVRVQVKYLAGLLNL